MRHDIVYPSDSDGKYNNNQTKTEFEYFTEQKNDINNRIQNKKKAYPKLRLHASDS